MIHYCSITIHGSVRYLTIMEMTDRLGEKKLLRLTKMKIYIVSTTQANLSQLDSRYKSNQQIYGIQVG